MIRGLLTVAEIEDQTPGDALRTLEHDYRWRVDRRLRAVGLYPLTQDQCSHTQGLEHDALRLVFRCERCGFVLTAEILARLQRMQAEPNASVHLRHLGAVIGRGLAQGVTGPSAAALAAVARRIAQMAAQGGVS